MYISYVCVYIYTYENAHVYVCVYMYIFKRNEDTSLIQVDYSPVVYIKFIKQIWQKLHVDNYDRKRFVINRLMYNF